VAKSISPVLPAGVLEGSVFIGEQMKSHMTQHAKHAVELENQANAGNAMVQGDYMEIMVLVRYVILVTAEAMMYAINAEEQVSSSTILL
jgi:hypothetical protein